MEAETEGKVIEIKGLVEKMVCSIIDEEEDILITLVNNDEGVLFEVTVGKDDVGKLIGKGGRVASAPRTVAKASGAKNGIKVLLNIMNRPLEK
jgi:predicted RNA-binding protein YlqC (UPF0109 family)